MKPYTVLLLRPDYIAEPYGQDTYMAHVEAENPVNAIEAAQIEVWKEDHGDDAGESWTDYNVLLIIEGHHRDLYPVRLSPSPLPHAPMSAPHTVAVGQNLWVAVYEHKYGMDTFACTTRLAAEILREGVAAQSWEAEMGDLPKPSDPEELADAYFDEMGSHGEFFTIHETTLQGG